MLENANRVSEETYRNWTKRATPQAGDLILAREAPVGNVAIVPLGMQVCLGQRVVLIRPNVDKVDPNYLLYLLLGDEIQNRFYALTAGATVPHLNMSEIRNLKLPEMPSKAVQNVIGLILSAYDDLIENNLRRIRILEKIAQNIYTEWFVKFRFPGHQHARFTDSPIGRILEGWEVVPLSSVVDFAKGRKPVETRNEPIAGDVRLLLIDALRGGEPQFTAPARLVIAEAHDTIMVMDGGSSCEVALGFSGAVGSTLGRFRTTKPDRFSPHALYRFLEEKADEFKSKNIGAAIPHANKDYILTQTIPLPPQTIALGFHDYLEPIQGTIEILKAKNHPPPDPRPAAASADLWRGGCVGPGHYNRRR